MTERMLAYYVIYFACMILAAMQMYSVAAALTAITYSFDHSDGYKLKKVVDTARNSLKQSGKSSFETAEIVLAQIIESLPKISMISWIVRAYGITRLLLIFTAFVTPGIWYFLDVPGSYKITHLMITLLLFCAVSSPTYKIIFELSREVGEGLLNGKGR